MAVAVERGALEGFFRRRLGPAALSAPPGGAVHAALLDAALSSAAPGPARRRASLCLDGTPVVYSLKLTRGGEAPAFRMLVEPGGVHTTVPEQAGAALEAADALARGLGWGEGADELREAAACLLPADRAAMLDWWGGVWLGMECGGGGAAELRAYFNLRHGGPLARWQRVADLLCRFGDEGVAAPLRELLERVPPHAVPVGVGVGVAGRLRGFRLYAGVEAPGAEAVRAACAPPRAAAAEVERFCGAFTAEFGAFTRQSATLGFDFAVEGGRVAPRVARTKADFSCQLLRGDARPALVGLVRRFAGEWGLAAAGLDGFLADLDAGFGGWHPEYLSLGLGEDGVSHLTVYVRPEVRARAA